MTTIGRATMLAGMAIPPPFAGIDRRTVWLRATLLAATFLGMLASAPLWLNTRSFPLCRLTPGFPVLPAPWDKAWFAAMLVSLVLACWFYRWSVAFFLVAGFYAFCEDQNRGQPWFYMYWVMLLLTLLPECTALAACRFSISAAYIWSGIQKFNPHFFGGTPIWFVSPAEHWHLPSGAIQFLRWCVMTAPFVEIGIGLGVWVRGLRRAAIAAAVMVHLVSLVFLGPLGHNYNWIVWPWNVAMIALVCALFAGGIRITQAFADLRRSKLAVAIVALYSLLPALSFSGRWDSEFSFTLYAENQANANIFVTQAFADRLPPEVKRYVQPFQTNYDRDHQGPCVLVFGAWCYEELHVPVFPEPRNFLSIFRHLQAWSREPGDLRIIIGPRAGPVIFGEGDTTTLLPRKD